MNASRISDRDVWAGIALVAVGALAIYGSAELPFMTRQGVGAGLVPRIVGGLILALGVVQAALAFRKAGVRVGDWAWREIVIVLGAVVVFGIAIRGATVGPLAIPALGIVVAGPASVIIAGLADRTTRPVELIAFAVGITAVCTAIFRFALGIPVPVAPWLIGY